MKASRVNSLGRVEPALPVAAGVAEAAGVADALSVLDGAALTILCWIAAVEVAAGVLVAIGAGLAVRVGAAADAPESEPELAPLNRAGPGILYALMSPELTLNKIPGSVGV